MFRLCSLIRVLRLCLLQIGCLSAFQVQIFSLKIWEPNAFACFAAGGRSTLNLERRLDHDGHPLAITAADAVTANGVPPWNWRDAPANGKLFANCEIKCTEKNLCVDLVSEVWKFRVLLLLLF